MVDSEDQHNVPCQVQDSLCDKSASPGEISETDGIHFIIFTLFHNLT